MSERFLRRTVAIAVVASLLGWLPATAYAAGSVDRESASFSPTTSWNPITYVLELFSSILADSVEDPGDTGSATGDDETDSQGADSGETENDGDNGPAIVVDG